MDVIALHQAGIAQAVAPLGTALTENPLEGLWRLADDPVLCFDGDEAGARAAARAVERALPLLNAKRSLRFATLPAGQDPDTMVRDRGREAMAEIVDAAIPLSDQLWRMTASGRALDTPEARGGDQQAASGPDRPDPRPRPRVSLSGGFPATTAAAVAGAEARAGRNRSWPPSPRCSGARRSAPAVTARPRPASAPCFRPCSVSPRWWLSSTRRWHGHTSWRRRDSPRSWPRTGRMGRDRGPSRRVPPAAFEALVEQRSRMMWLPKSS